ncbi:MAG: tRNA (guanine(10)-N(2))-dimethyltransferase [Promethearchaeota archaeon]
MSNNKNLKKIRENTTNFLIYGEDYNSTPSKSMKVFYNKKMILNRDITSLAINAYANMFNQNSLTIVDSMAATGIGAIRLIKECKNISTVYINDINPLAIEMARENLKLNDITNHDVNIRIFNEDANLLFNKIKKWVHESKNKNARLPDVILIDPFGTPNLHLDAAFKAIKKEGGLMCITATDTAVLFGVRPKACYRKYLAKPLHVEYCKEIGSRILICFSSKIANINNLGVIPLLTFYSKHFIRIFLLTFKNKNQIHENFKNYGYILHCQCNHRMILEDPLNFPDVCPACHEKNHSKLAGPLWLGELHNMAFLEKLRIFNEKEHFPNKKRIAKILEHAKEEIGMPPYYYNIHKICQELNLSPIPKLDVLINLIQSKGFKATRTHFDFVSIKTTMTHEKLKDTLFEITSQIR